MFIQWFLLVLFILSLCFIIYSVNFDKVYEFDNQQQVLIHYQQLDKISHINCSVYTRSFYSSPQYNTLSPPVILYSFPGSGNTWCRLLLEYATGIYSGSLYDDNQLMPLLPGEYHCDHTVNVIKAHPHLHSYIDLLNITKLNKCQFNENIKKFNKAILLVRNPYHAIWSEFQRRKSNKHNAGVLKSSYNNGYGKLALFLSRKYVEMWARDYRGFQRFGDTILIKYEDLRNSSTRLDRLIEMTKFINSSVEIDVNRFHCSFDLSINPSIYRSKNSIVSTKYLNKDDVYTETLVCQMWNILHTYCEKLNYKPYNNYNCSLGAFY